MRRLLAQRPFQRVELDGSTLPLFLSEIAMKMMKAAVVHAFGQPLQVEEVPVPDVPDGQVLVKVVASGVCHTDLHAANATSSR